VEEIIFSKNQSTKNLEEVTTRSLNYLVVYQPQKLTTHRSMGSMGLQHSNQRFFLGWTSTSKTYNPLFHGIHDITTFKHQRFFLGVNFTVDFYTPRFMKIRWYYYFWIFCTSLLNQVEHTLLKS
jgi:hypothetical protein